MERLLLIALCAVVLLAAQRACAQERPVIEKRGTLDCDMVETTPVVFNGRLYRFEYVRAKYYEPNTTGDSYFRFVDVAAGTYTPSFARGFHLGSAHAHGGTMYVYGVEDWGASRMSVFWSTDLENWQSRNVLDIPGWTLYNNSVCMVPSAAAPPLRGQSAAWPPADAGEAAVMAFEVGAPPEVVGHRFTTYFAASADLLNWHLVSMDCVHTKEFYSACPALRYLDGWYYNIYLKSYPGYWAQHITRSRDLVHWHESPLNPVLKHSGEDKRIANPNLTAQQRERIANAKNVNNSDFDMCEFGGELIINYSWGNQHGVEHLAEAVYHGTEEQFLKAWYPEDDAGATAGLPGAVQDGMKVVFVGAHPDDEVYAAPLLAFAADHSRAEVLCATAGESGGCFLAEPSPLTLGQVRTLELTKACGLLGAAPFVFSCINGKSTAHPEGIAVLESGEQAVARWLASGEADETPEDIVERWARECPDFVEQVREHIVSAAPCAVITFDPAHGVTGHAEHRALGIMMTQLFNGEAGLDPPGTGVRAYYVVHPDRAKPDDIRIEASELVERGSRAYAELALDAFSMHESQLSPIGSEGNANMAEHFRPLVETITLRPVSVSR